MWLEQMNVCLKAPKKNVDFVLPGNLLISLMCVELTVAEALARVHV